ncbi:unnamed protein product [Colias eurytheme]|nr:unnamed protein product [Colias eurytheme]
MADKTICSKCKDVVDIKRCLKCSHCKQILQFDCAGISQKMYFLMSKESRDKWACKKCVSRLQSNDQELTNNITMRKEQYKHTITSTNQQDIDEPKESQIVDSHILTDSSDELFCSPLKLTQPQNKIINNNQTTIEDINKLISQLKNDPPMMKPLCRA